MNAARIETRDMLSTEYNIQTFEVTSIRPKAATKLAVIDARMANVRKEIREITERLRRASEQGRAA